MFNLESRDYQSPEPGGKMVKKMVEKSTWKMEKQTMDIWLGKQFALYIITCFTVKMGDSTETYKHL